MKKNGKILILSLVAVLMGAFIALFAGASERTGVLTVVYPNGTVQTFAEGETVSKPAVPADFPLIKDGKAYKYTVTGDAWEYSSPLPETVSASDLGKTVTASVAGACGTQQVYYTSLEKTDAKGTVLVYHMTDNLNTFLGTSNTGDRADGTNTGASSYTELRKKTSETKITLYADHTCSSFTINWYVSSDRYLGGPVYLDLNGHTVTNTQTSWISANGMTLYLYSSLPDAHWYQTRSSAILRVNDDIKFHIGDDASGRYTDNLSVHAKALFHDVYGSGAYVIGGRYYQTGTTTRGGMIDIKRRMYKLENAKIFVLPGQTPLTDVTADDSNDSPVGKGKTAIKNCVFYAPEETSVLSSTKVAKLRFEGCKFINITMDTTAGTGATLSYAAGNYTNIPLRMNLGKTEESIYPTKLADPLTVSLSDADGAPIEAELTYMTRAVGGGLTVSYADGESMLRLVGEEIGWKTAEDARLENGVVYVKTSDIHTAFIDGEKLSSATVTEEMAGKSAEATVEGVYEPALFGVIVGDRVVAYGNEETVGADLAACLSSLKSGAVVKLFSDITLPPVTVLGERLENGAAAESASAVLDLNGHTLTFTGSGVAMRVLMPGFSIISSAEGAEVVAKTHALFATGSDDYKWIGGAAYLPDTSTYAEESAGDPITPQGFVSICKTGAPIAFTAARVNADLHGNGAEILGGSFLQSEESASPYFLLLSREDTAADALARIENATFVITDEKSAPLFYRAVSAVTFKNCRFLNASGESVSLFAKENTALSSSPVFENCDFFDILPVLGVGACTVSFENCGFGFSDAVPTEDFDPETGVARFVLAEEKTVSAFGASYRIDCALHREEYDSVQVLYPDGTVVTLSVGEKIPNYSMPDTKTEDRRLYKLVGSGWSYSLFGNPIQGSTVPPEASGECLVAQGYEYKKVYYTTREEVASGTVLVYHLKNDFASYFTEENEGDRGDGTNTGANAYTVLRLSSTKKVVVTLYENMQLAYFSVDWDDPNNQITGRPVYLDLNGFTVQTPQSDFVDLLGMQLYIYSSVPGALWDQPGAKKMFRPNDRATLYLGNNAEDGAYADNITFRGQALFETVYGGGAYIYGGHYRQTKANGVFVEISRRIKTMSNASFYVAEGTSAVLGHTIAADGSNILKGTKAIKNCYFYAPTTAFLLYATGTGASPVYENCRFEGVVNQTMAEYAVIVYPDGTEQQVILKEELTLASPALTYMDENGNLFYLSRAHWRLFTEDGKEIFETEVSQTMLGNRYIAVADHTYLRVFFTVSIGENITYNTNADGYAEDLAASLSAMERNATVTLYSDVVLFPVRVTGKNGYSRAEAEAASYALDLNGRTISFAESAGVAFTVRVPSFFLYSSAPGGRILCEGMALFTTAQKQYELKNGTKITLQGNVTVGEPMRAAVGYAENLSVICRAVNAPSEGGSVYLYGASFTQSLAGESAPFLFVSGMQAFSASGTKFVLCSGVAAISYLGVQDTSFTDCIFISSSESAVPLFLFAAVSSARVVQMENCGFYNLTPELTLGYTTVSYTNSFFGFSFLPPSGDLDSGGGAAYIVTAQSKTVSVLGRPYILSYTLEVRTVSGCTVVYPDGTEQIFAVGAPIEGLTDEESFVGKNGLLYKRSAAGWRFLYGGTELADLTVTQAMVGTTVTATGYDRVYFTVADGETITYYIDEATAATSLHSYLGAMDPGAVITLWSDLSIKKVSVIGKRFADDGSIGNGASYYFDLNGHTLTITGSGLAMDIMAASFHLYSTKPGAKIYAQTTSFFRSNNDDYKLINGSIYAQGTSEYSAATGIAAIKISGLLYFGESSENGTEYGENITVYCKRINEDMYGAGVYFLGGTFVQSEDSTADYFLLLSRVKYGSSHIKAVRNTTFVITKAGTEPLFYNSGATVDFTDCRFISTAGANLLCYTSSVYTKAPRFIRCDFYDITPVIRIGTPVASFEDCRFGFSSTVPMGDLDTGSGAVAQLSQIHAAEILVLESTYTLTHALVQTDLGFCTVVYPDGRIEIVYAGSEIVSSLNATAFFADGVLYADLGEGWIYSVDGVQLTSLTVDASLVGKTVIASGYGRVYFSVTVGETVTYYTNASTYQSQFFAYLGAMEPGARITLYADASTTKVTVKGKRCADVKILQNASYALDLNGHTITFTGTSGIAIDVMAAGFSIYSSVPGGCLRAEHMQLFRSNDDDYKWVDGVAYSKGTTGYNNASGYPALQVIGLLLLGEPNAETVCYGENLTVICSQINADMYGAGASLLGGTFVQSESSNEKYFLRLSREGSTYSHIVKVQNATFVIRSKATAVMHYRAATAVSFNNCCFISAAGGEVSLFSSTVSTFPTSPAFRGCRFYDVTPESARGKAVYFEDCRFGFSGLAPIVDGMYLAHTADYGSISFDGKSYTLDIRIVSDLSEVCTVIWGDGFKEYWMLGTVPQCNAARLDTVVYGENGTAVAKKGAMIGTSGIRTVTEAMLGTVRHVEVSYLSVEPVAFSYTSASGVTFYQTMRQGATAAEVGELFHETFDTCDDAYTIRLHTDILLSKGLGWGPLGTLNNVPEYKSLTKGSVTLDLNGFTITASADCVGVNASNSNSTSSYSKPSWGIFAFETATENTFTLTSSRPGARIENLSGCSLIVVGEQSSAKVVIEGENLTVQSKGSIVFFYEIATGASLTVRGGSYHYEGSVSPFIVLATAKISDAEIYMTGAPISAFGAHYYNRGVNLTVENTLVYCANQTKLFAFFDSHHKKQNATSGYTRKLSLVDCVFIGVTLTSPDSGLNSVSHSGTAAPSEEALLEIYGTQPENTALAFLERTVEGKTYRFVAYLAPEKIGVVDWGFGLPKENWRIGETATRSSAVVGGTFGYVFLPTQVDKAEVIGRASLSAIRPGIMQMSLTLQGQIGMNIYLSAAFGATEITVAGITYDLSLLSPQNGYYVFTAPIPSNLADKGVQIVLHALGYEHAMEVSIERYASTILASDDYAGAHDLVYAMVAHIRAQTGASFASCSVPDGYFAKTAEAYASQNSGNELLSAITFRLDGTISLAVLGAEGVRVNLVLSSGRSETAVISDGTVIFDKIYINEFFGDMQIRATKNGKTETYVYNLLNYLYHQTDPALIEKVSSLYNYTYFAHAYVDALGVQIRDENGDHICDICKKSETPHTDKDANGLCDLCGGALGWSEGLVFEENGDGTYTLVGMGECKDLVLTVPDTYLGAPVSAIAPNALQGASIKKLILPESLSMIGAGALRDCAALETVVIGRGVCDIGENAFLGASALQAVYYRGRAAMWRTIFLGEGNAPLSAATVYFYSETRPETDGNYWYEGEDGAVIHCFDFDHDHLCDECGAHLTDHSDMSRDHYCDRCEIFISGCADADFDHLCDVCLAILSVCADENRDHLCDICRVSLSDHSNTDGDHFCDFCGGRVSACVDAGKDHFCDLCAEKISDCADENRDHLCDVCAKTLSVCTDESRDHFCDLCAGRLSFCRDNDADHICDVCALAVSVHTDADLNHICDLCGKDLGDCIDENRDHLCDACGEIFSVCADANADHLCDLCDKKLPCTDLDGDHICEICREMATECEDADLNHLCDLCGARVSVCADTDRDHLCDDCRIPLSVHADLDADHICDICAARISDCTDENGDHLCDDCLRTVSVCRDGGEQLCTLCGRFLASEGLRYRENADGSYTVIGIGDCTDTYIYIPKYYNGKAVTAIAGSAFAANRTITGVCVPSGVKHIGIGAFIACPNLTDLVIGDGVQTVGAAAFALCAGLESAHIGSVDTVGTGAFYSCTALETLTVDGARVIALGAFRRCTSLTSVALPEGLSVIGLYAFSECTALTEIYLPESVRRVGYSAFSACEALRSVYLAGINDTLSSASIADGNRLLKDARRYFFTESAPTAGQGHFWYTNENGEAVCVTLCPVHADENHNRVCDFCGEKVACAHDLDAEGYCLWCSYFVCVAHCDYDADHLCDLCGAGIDCGGHEDKNGDHDCDLCGTGFACKKHADADGDGLCEHCLGSTEISAFPWENETITLQMNNHSGGGVLSSRVQSFMAGEIISASAFSEAKIVERNAEATAITGVTPIYRYLAECNDLHSWSMRYEAIIKQQATGITPDVYIDFAYDMIGASLVGCFANLKTQSAENYFAFASDADYGETVGDRDGYMYGYMTSLAFDGERMYLLASDYLIDTVRAFYCVPTNAEILEELSAQDILGLGRENTLADLTAAVQSGAWTYELMMRYSAAMADGAHGRLGLALAGSEQSAAGFVYTSAVEIFGNAVGGVYETKAENEALYTFAKALNLLATADGVRVVSDESEARLLFSEGRALFGGVALLGSLETNSYKYMQDGVLILPVPVQTRGVAYETRVHDYGRLGAISAKTQKFSACSAFLNYQSTHSDGVLSSYFENDLRAGLERGRADLAAANAEMLSFMRASVGSARSQMLEISISLLCSNRIAVSPDGEGGFTALRWQSILVTEKYDATFVRSYHRMLREQKDRVLFAIYENGVNSLPR